MIFALSLVPVSLMTGFGIDIWRQNEAQTAAQHAADAAALAAASGDGQTEAQLLQDAEAFVEANLPDSLRSSSYTLDVDYNSDQHITVNLNSEIPAMFSGLIGRNTLPIKGRAVATRAGPGDDPVEIALVLDNTYSMSADIGGGRTRIQALQAASLTLINQVIPAGSNSNVRVSIVPYADYVNVGVNNRNQPWVDVPPDEIRTNPATYWDETVFDNPVYTICWGHHDGNPVAYQCIDTVNSTGRRVVRHDVPADSQLWTWHGCVGSRTQGNLRLSDNAPNIPYPGFLSIYRSCLNPIVPLTNDRAQLTSAINGLIINVGGYMPGTYIPTGLVWGLNVLSSTEPFTEGDRFHRGTRKVLVLMSDGANTMYFDPAEGRHYDAMITADPTRWIGESDSEALTLCRTIKRNGIEIYTIGLAVPNGAARTLMRDCASSPSQAFNAANAQSLVDAFRNVGASINSSVRLVE